MIFPRGRLRTEAMLTAVIQGVQFGGRKGGAVGFDRKAFEVQISEMLMKHGGEGATEDTISVGEPGHISIASSVCGDLNLANHDEK